MLICSHAFCYSYLTGLERCTLGGARFGLIQSRKKIMNKRDLKTIHRQLNRWLEDLYRDADCNLDGLEVLDEPLPDIVDRASNHIERALSHNFCDRGNLLIKKINRALNDIADGTYGVCNLCGEDIAIKRLKASPVTRYCLSCKTELETRKRLTEA